MKWRIAKASAADIHDLSRISKQARYVGVGPAGATIKKRVIDASGQVFGARCVDEWPSSDERMWIYGRTPAWDGATWKQSRVMAYQLIPVDLVRDTVTDMLMMMFDDTQLL